LLDEVLGSYLDSLSEREFDAPFMALLRAHDFYDIHFLHGQYEFGKDFIAKRREDGTVVQYAVQTKAGDLDVAAYRVVRGQIDDLRRNATGHPSYDKSARRRAVLVTTGRLTGATPATAQGDQEDLRARGETDFDVWDRERLVELMRDVPETGYPQGATGAFLGLLAAIDQRSIVEDNLESHSRGWIFPPGDLTGLRRTAIEAGILSNRLRRVKRDDLASYVALCLVRAAWASAPPTDPPEPEAVLIADLARRMFVAYAGDIWARCEGTTLEPRGFLTQQQQGLIYLSYPVGCLRLVETLGLLALLPDTEAISNRDDLLTFLTEFIGRQPGASHPISDRWAVSVIPPVLALARTARPAIEVYLRSLVTWTCDRYEAGQMGLAGPRATAGQESFLYLGAGIPAANRPRRIVSFLASVLLDLLAVTEMGELYELAVNDVRHVKALPETIETADDPSQYGMDGVSLVRSVVDYPERWSPTDGWKIAPHHLRAPADYYLSRIGRPWDHLAVSSVLRDRHFLPTMRLLYGDS
jgi:hypothetical protein